MPDPSSRLLRVDALENRENVLEAARELFAEQGLGVPLREIARRAGVGPATLYRRFPTKKAIVEEAFDDELRTCRRIVVDGAADSDPWRGFSSVVIGLAELNARNRAFVDAFLTDYPDSVDFAAHRADLLRLLTGLTRRAQSAGELRADFVLDDLVLVLLAGRAVAAVPSAVRLAAARRLATLSIDGFRATNRSSVLPPQARLVSPLIRRPASPQR